MDDNLYSNSAGVEKFRRWLSQSRHQDIVCPERCKSGGIEEEVPLLEETYGSVIEMGTMPKECNADPKP